MEELRNRQVHLDFHTSPYIAEIAQDFNPEEFAGLLKTAQVNSVTCFAKCHHGMCYYPTQVGTVHPGLKIDLLGEMIRACHAQGIKTPVYITVGWDEDSAEKHPEWLQVNMKGVLGDKDPFGSEYYTWRHLCHNNREYVDRVLAHTGEILDRYDADGIFYDIVFQIGCICNCCKASMKELGLDPSDEADVRKHDFMVIKNFMERVTNFINARKPGMRVYYNTGYIPDINYDHSFSIQEKIKYNTHIEIESLPSGKWGYNHFPLAVNFHNYTSRELLGMTGKFHKCWGDFGSLKNRAALEYEIFRMIANGAQCSIGDQLHPSGRLDPAVYQRIGAVYQSVAAKEPWCQNTQKVAEIGIITANGDLAGDYRVDESDEGAMRMLMELHQPFDMIDSTADLAGYRLLILPDFVLLNHDLTAKIENFIKNGGAVLLSNRSGFNPAAGGFSSPVFGVNYLGDAPYAPDYLRLEDCFRSDIEPMDYCFYEKGTKVEALAGGEVLARIRVPYFNRSYDRFCSHCQTPPDQLTDSPGIVRRGKVIYIAKPIFKDYIISGTKVYRDIVRNCLDLLLPDPLIKAALPASVEVTLRKQGERQILHLLNYIPQRKCREMDIVEDIIPLFNQDVAIRMVKPASVYSAPQKTAIEFQYEDGYAAIRIPVINGHAMVVLE